MRLSRGPGRAVHQELRDEEIGRGDAPFHRKARLFCRRFQGGLIESVYLFLHYSPGAEKGRIALNRLFHDRNPIVLDSVITDFIIKLDHLFLWDIVKRSPISFIPVVRFGAILSESKSVLTVEPPLTVKYAQIRHSVQGCCHPARSVACHL